MRLICVFIFLTAMAFTVLQYLPVLEEEAPTHRVDSKKAKHASFPDNDSVDDDDNDPDPDPEIDFYPVNHFIYVHKHSQFFSRCTPQGLRPSEPIHTPPPRG